MSEKENEVYVTLEFTPNPNTLKYSINREFLAKGALNMTDLEDAKKKSPLAAQLFAVPGICAVMIGKNFITVTKSDEGDWDIVHQNASATIEKYLSKEDSLFTEDYLTDSQKSDQNVKNGSSPASDIENRIREILDNEIRPAVAMDGGDITFDRFEDGVVYLFMQGSCSGCPSSTATLKMGIETRLRDAIPEVVEVVSV